MRAINQKPSIAGTTIEEKDYYIDESGYKRYCLSKRLVHRVIASQVFGNIQGLVVHHKNYDKLDNRSCNLEVMTEESHDELHLRHWLSSHRHRPDGLCAVCGCGVSQPHHEYCYSCWLEHREEEDEYEYG